MAFFSSLTRQKPLSSLLVSLLLLLSTLNASPVRHPPAREPTWDSESSTDIEGSTPKPKYSEPNIITYLRPIERDTEPLWNALGPDDPRFKATEDKIASMNREHRHLRGMAQVRDRAYVKEFRDGEVLGFAKGASGDKLLARGMAATGDDVVRVLLPEGFQNDFSQSDPKSMIGAYRHSYFFKYAHHTTLNRMSTNPPQVTSLLYILPGPNPNAIAFREDGAGNIVSEAEYRRYGFGRVVAAAAEKAARRKAAADAKEAADRKEATERQERRERQERKEREEAERRRKRITFAVPEKGPSAPRGPSAPSGPSSGGGGQKKGLRFGLPFRSSSSSKSGAGGSSGGSRPGAVRA